MAVLPEGMTIELAINKKTKELCWHVSCSEEYIKRTMLSILEKRIERAEIALPLCKHTKRKHRLTKLLIAMKQCITELEEIDVMDDEDFRKLEAKAISVSVTTNKSAEEVADALKDFSTRMEGTE